MHFGLPRPAGEGTLVQGFFTQVTRSQGTWAVLVRPRNPLSWQRAPSSPWEASMLHTTTTTRFLFQEWKTQVVLTTQQMAEPIHLKRITHFICTYLSPWTTAYCTQSSTQPSSREHHAHPGSCTVHNLCNSTQQPSRTEESHPQTLAHSNPLLDPWIFFT